MPANEFENKVQEIFDDLKLKPSTPVWPNIEKRIRREKDRRRIIIWMFFLFLLLTGGAWIYFQTTKEKTVPGQNPSDYVLKNKSTAIESVNQKNPTATEKQKDHLIGKKNETDKATIDNPAIETKQVKSKDASGEIHGLKTISENKQITRGSKVITAGKKDGAVMVKPTKEDWKNNIGVKDLNVTKTPNESPALQKQSTIADTIEKSNSIATEHERKPANTDTSGITSSLTIKADSIVSIQQPNIAENNQNVQPTTTDTIAKKKTKKNKWEKVISASAGVSNYQYGLFDNSRADAFATPATGGGPLSSGGGGSITNSEINKGLAFNIGFELQRSLNSRFNLSAGIQYHFLSTRIATGSKIQNDTLFNYGSGQVAVSDFYRNGTTYKTVNSFHFVEIPVNVEYKFQPASRFSISAGISYGRLIKTTALVFNTSANIYFEDQNEYRKNHLNGFSSLQYTWLRSRKIKIQSGPAIQYSFTELRKTNQNGIPHLYSAEIKSRIIF